MSHFADDETLAMIADLEQKIDAREKQAVLLREALKGSIDADVDYFDWRRQAVEALKGTQDLSGLILCDTEPVGWMNPYGGVLPVLSTGLEKSTYIIPLYQARKAK